MHEFYRNKKIFITGHTGFKGSWLNLWLEEIGAEVAGYSLPAAELSHYNHLNLKSKNYIGNTNDYHSLKSAMSDFRPDIVFHMAAQALVRESYDNPVETFKTNLLGTLNVYKASHETDINALVSITTDKVYENKEISSGYSEEDSLGGHDPYSASKACVEIMTNSYRRSFLGDHKFLLATARAGNSIGGGDWGNDRLIPDLVKNASIQSITTIRNPNSIRPWQHVLDPLNGYLLLGEKLLQGKAEFASAFNFGPSSGEGLTVANISRLAAESWKDIRMKFETDLNDKNEANILLLDISKSKEMLNWKPRWDTKTATNKAIEWYKKYYTEKIVTTRECLADYLKS